MKRKRNTIGTKMSARLKKIFNLAIGNTSEQEAATAWGIAKKMLKTEELIFRVLPTNEGVFNKIKMTMDGREFNLNWKEFLVLAMSEHQDCVMIERDGGTIVIGEQEEIDYINNRFGTLIKFAVAVCGTSFATYDSFSFSENDFGIYSKYFYIAFVTTIVNSLRKEVRDDISTRQDMLVVSGLLCPTKIYTSDASSGCDGSNNIDSGGVEENQSNETTEPERVAVDLESRDSKVTSRKEMVAGYHNGHGCGKTAMKLFRKGDVDGLPEMSRRVAN